MQTTIDFKSATIDEAKEFIKEKLLTDDKWLVRGLLAIYRRQTDDEKNSGITKHHNSVGFNGLDSEILSSFAVQYTRRKFLSSKQLEITRKKMVKYAAQLANIAKAG